MAFFFLIQTRRVVINYNIVRARYQLPTFRPSDERLINSLRENFCRLDDKRMTFVFPIFIGLINSTEIQPRD